MRPALKAGNNLETLLEPLRRFYQAAGYPVPQLFPLAGNTIPQPYRDLLVHTRGMTSILQHFHNDVICIKVIASRCSAKHYAREVLLLTRNGGKTVEFGAISIAIEELPLNAQAQLLQEEKPLGEILQDCQIAFESEPQAFFKIISDSFTNIVFDLSQSKILYGRCNRILIAKRSVLAEVVEILSPL